MKLSRRAGSRRLLLTIAAAALALEVALAQQDGVLRFDWSAPGPDGLPAGWRPLTFKDIRQHTRYATERDGEGFVMKAEANGSASGPIHPVDADPRRTALCAGAGRWRTCSARPT
jgi:hypothetical protein